MKQQASRSSPLNAPIRSRAFRFGGMLPFLLGVGLRSFSIDIVHAPEVQRLVNAASLEYAAHIADRMLELGRISEIEAYLIDRNLAPEIEA